MLKVSHSRIKAWRSCHRKHYNRYVRKLKRRVKGKPLQIGSLGHDCLHCIAEKKPWLPVIKEYERGLQKLFVEEREDFIDIPNRMVQIIRRYLKKYEGDGLKYPRLKGQRSEHRVEIDMGKDILFTAYLDKIPQDEQGNFWLMEHKFTKQMPDEAFRIWDVQTILYAWIMPKAGYPEPYGVLWDYIRTKPPAIPDLLKSGALSQKKSMDTDIQTYRDAIKQHGLREKDYREMLDHLKGREVKFFNRIPLPIPEDVLKWMIRDFWTSVAEIRHLGEKLRDMNTTWLCRNCEYEPLCRAEIQGLDISFVLKANYVQKEESENDEAESRSEED